MNSQSKLILEIAEKTGLKPDTIRYRLKKGWSIDKILSTPLISKSEAAKKHEVLGKTFTDRFGNEFIVKDLAYRDKSGVGYYNCEFLKSGYKTTAVVSQIIGTNRHVFDRYSPSVHNVGIMGDAYAKDNPKLFDVWRAMIARCYNPKNASYKTYGAKGITVCDRWKRFDYFLSDVKSLPGFDESKIDNGLIVLDKDIINREAKTYSNETCCFVSRSENTRESSLRWHKEKSISTSL